MLKFWQHIMAAHSLAMRFGTTSSGSQRISLWAHMAASGPGGLATHLGSFVPPPAAAADIIQSDALSQVPRRTRVQAGVGRTI